MERPLAPRSTCSGASSMRSKSAIIASSWSSPSHTPRPLSKTATATNPTGWLAGWVAQKGRYSEIKPRANNQYRAPGAANNATLSLSSNTKSEKTQNGDPTSRLTTPQPHAPPHRSDCAPEVMRHGFWVRRYGLPAQAREVRNQERREVVAEKRTNSTKQRLRRGEAAPKEHTQRDTEGDHPGSLQYSTAGHCTLSSRYRPSVPGAARYSAWTRRSSGRRGEIPGRDTWACISNVRCVASQLEREC